MRCRLLSQCKNDTELEHEEPQAFIIPSNVSTISRWQRQQTQAAQQRRAPDSSVDAASVRSHPRRRLDASPRRRAIPSQLWGTMSAGIPLYPMPRREPPSCRPPVHAGPRPTGRQARRSLIYRCTEYCMYLKGPFLLGTTSREPDGRAATQPPPSFPCMGPWISALLNLVPSYTGLAALNYKYNSPRLDSTACLDVGSNDDMPSP